MKNYTYYTVVLLALSSIQPPRERIIKWPFVDQQQEEEEQNFLILFLLHVKCIQFKLL